LKACLACALSTVCPSIGVVRALVGSIGCRSATRFGPLWSSGLVIRVMARAVPALGDLAFVLEY
jgi:hypothetical protein